MKMRSEANSRGEAKSIRKKPGRSLASWPRLSWRGDNLEKYQREGRVQFHHMVIKKPMSMMTKPTSKFQLPIAGMG